MAEAKKDGQEKETAGAKPAEKVQNRQMGIRLAPVDNSDQPVVANYCAINVAAAGGALGGKAAGEAEREARGESCAAVRRAGEPASAAGAGVEGVERGGAGSGGEEGLRTGRAQPFRPLELSETVKAGN